MRIVVVGAGVIGSAVAFECARRGARVEVLDPRLPGGATHASAGILAPYIEGHSPALRRLGVRGLAVYDAFLARLNESSDTRPEYGRGGTLQAAFDDEGARELTESAGLLVEAGVAHTLLGGGAARALEPSLSDRVVAALEIPDHGYVNPTALVDALVAGAAAHGATFSQTRVVGLDSSATAVHVHAETGRFDADAVVLAAGSWTSCSWAPAPSRGGEPPIRPIRGQLLHLRAAVPVTARVLWGPGCYVVPRRDGTLLVGATVEDVGFDERATLGGVRAVADAASALVPALDQAVLQEVRVGLRPATPDELPIVGPSATMPQVYFASGHYRNGVLLAPLTAGLVADLVLEGRAGAELSSLHPTRFGL